MALWTIRGGKPLYGRVPLQGSVNEAMPILAATLLHKGTTVLENVPRVGAVDELLEMLACLQCSVKREGNRVTVDSTSAVAADLTACKGAARRQSVLLLAAMIARFGQGAVPMPRGCVLGPRPLDVHLAVLEAMGAKLRLTDTHILCMESSLQGGEVYLPVPDATATEMALLLACGSTGTVVIRNCAREPEAAALASYLCACGHEVHGVGTAVMTVSPHDQTADVRHTLMPDRIAAATLLCAVAACGGKLILQEVMPIHLHPILDVLAEMGCNIKIRDTSVTLCSEGRLWAPSGEIVTGAYPGLPTEVLPIFLSACLRADGVTVVREEGHGGRLMQAKQLRRFGGNVALGDDCMGIVTGVSELCPAHVRARDVQGGAALLIGALQAEGESCIVDDGMISRCYEYLDGDLRRLGADLEYTD